MRGADRVILMSLMLVALLGAFYFLLLAPKRAMVSELSTDVTELQASISAQEQTVLFAEQARDEFPEHYGRMVVLGKAVPGGADSASMLVQLSSVAERTKVDFRGISVAEASSAAAAPPAPAPAPAPAAGETPAAEGEGAESTPTSAAPAPATEATAATLPIGAGVGPAGLPTLPYELNFVGGFYEVADFIGQIDGFVSLRDGGGVAVNGRLMTIDGFALSVKEASASPELIANFAVTSYVTPAEQGLTLGATPGGPAPAPASPVQPQATPASAVTP